jgi:hypothetical protein
VSCSKFVFVCTVGWILVVLNLTKRVDALLRCLCNCMGPWSYLLITAELSLLNLVMYCCIDGAKLIRVHGRHCFTYFLMVVAIECTQFLYADHVVL